MKLYLKGIHSYNEHVENKKTWSNLFGELLLKIMIPSTVFMKVNF